MQRRSWHALARIGDEVLAVPLDAVREIVPPPRATRLPGAPPCVLGLGSWREQLAPIVAPHDLLGMKPFRQTSEARALIFENGSDDADRLEPLYLMVDAVLGVRQLTTQPMDGVVALRCAPMTAGWTSDLDQPDMGRHARLDPGRLWALLRRELQPTARQAA